MKKPRPYRVTRWLSDRKLCMGWLMHFGDKGVPAGIVCRSAFPNFAVWVHGVELQGEKTDREDLVTPSMTVHDERNGFEEIFKNYQEEVSGERPRVHKVKRGAASGAGVAAGLEA